MTSGHRLEHRGHALDPALAGHHDVHQRRRRACARAPRRPRARADSRLADDLDVGLGVEHAAQAGADDRVVVDEEDADAHACPAAFASPAPRPRSSSRRRGATRPSAGRRRARPARACRRARALPSWSPPARTPGRRPRRRPTATPSLRTSVMLTRRARRVLDDVRQRLLHDPVERGLDLRRQALVAEPRLEVDGELGSARRSVAARRSSAGTSPKSSSALGRSSTARRRTSCSVATTSSRSAAVAVAGVVGLDHVVEVLEPEQDRRQRLPGLVVQLAREPRALELLQRRRPGAARRG